MRLPATVGSALLLLFAASSSGKHLMPESVPVEELLKLGEATLAENPADAEANYTLARIHYLAFACGTTELEAYKRFFGDKPLPKVGPFQTFTTANKRDQAMEVQKRALAEMKLNVVPSYDSALGKQFQKTVERIQNDLVTAGWKSKELPDAVAASRIENAARYFETAMRLAPQNALYRLGYASLLEQARAWARGHAEAAPAFVEKLAAPTIRSEYRKAWEMELPHDLKDKDRGMMGLMEMVSYEAGSAFVRLAEAEADLTAEEAKTLPRIRASLGDLAKGRIRAVTPIVFAFSPVASIVNLLAEGVAVEFPLRGWGPAGRWPWLKPATALLVWNPSQSGQIVSGAQLFGSYTWELFWKTGYDALAVLDANGDGELSGAELDGLAAWQDANGNGVSDPGEVRPLRTLGVAALATVATGAEGPHPTHPAGVRFSDGRKLPTWDWMVEPLPDKSR